MKEGEQPTYTAPSFVERFKLIAMKVAVELSRPDLEPISNLGIVSGGAGLKKAGLVVVSGGGRNVSAGAEGGDAVVVLDTSE